MPTRSGKCSRVCHSSCSATCSGTMSYQSSIAALRIIAGFPGGRAPSGCPAGSSWPGRVRCASEWWRRGGSNSRPSHCERDALPAELRPHEGRNYSREGRLAVNLARIARALCRGRWVPCTLSAPTLICPTRRHKNTRHGHAARPHPAIRARVRLRQRAPAAGGLARAGVSDADHHRRARREGRRTVVAARRAWRSSPR